jgi:hypothetical protein
MKRFLRKIDGGKIKIAKNKEPIKMNEFLSFLTVETKRPEREWLGKCNGWTKIEGEGGLEITGGIVGGVEYLDHILYGENLDNPYNNYVNPFHLFDILTDEGKLFFLRYYSHDIKSILDKTKLKAQSAAKEHRESKSFWGEMGFDTPAQPADKAADDGIS